MIKRIGMLCVALLMFFSCSSFVMEEEQPLLRELENDVYILKTDVETNGVVLKKDSEVRLIVIGGDDWIKVYGYPAGDDKLKASRVLILYLFPEDFTDELFKMDVFREKLFTLVAARGK